MSVEEALQSFDRPVGTSELARFMQRHVSTVYRRLTRSSGVICLGLRNNGNGAPEKVWQLVNFRGEFAPHVPKQRKPKSTKAREIIRANLPNTVSTLVAISGYSRSTVLHHLTKLGAEADDLHHPAVWRVSLP